MQYDFTLYTAANEADKAWQAELVRLFGKRACDVRYTDQGKGEQGSTLRTLYNEFQRTSLAWWQNMEAVREARRVRA